jgi:hypothetical protein
MNNFLDKNSGIDVKHILIMQSCLRQETMVRFAEKLTFFDFHQTTLTHSRANVINRDWPTWSLLSWQHRMTTDPSPDCCQ